MDARALIYSPRVHVITITYVYASIWTAQQLIKKSHKCQGLIDQLAMSSQFHDSPATLSFNYYYTMYQYKCVIHYVLSNGIIYKQFYSNLYKAKGLIQNSV